ncbi:uncharacterized protein BXZ73DRAFT_104653 [Epithele typhae]|uniref:uncharacterized protein n=1 Tax=Epithele typhae TaxID=378194 RepID=UPI002007F64E|nr:uncharacterized protein BXZ73DRAFT_104653 [Epithele typhae]KAH9920528.1 hypothetical protein BXZ73DRAFT_104653 [Epithele typhae]
MDRLLRARRPPLPNALRVQRVGRHDVLATIIIGLEATRDGVDGLSAVPFLGGIVGAVLGIAKAAQQVGSTQDDFLQVAERADSLVKHIQKQVERLNPHDTVDDIETNLSTLLATMSSIRQTVESQVERGVLDRFMHRSSISSELKKCVYSLDSAWRSFDTAMLLSVHRKLETHSTHDPQLKVRRLFWDDLQLDDNRGSYYLNEDLEGEEFLGRLNQRPVIIRTITKKDGKPKEEYYQEVVKYHPDTDGPYARIAQVLGVAHPCLDRPFYVLEAGLNDRGDIVFHVSDLSNSWWNCVAESLQRLFAESRGMQMRKHWKCGMGFLHLASLGFHLGEALFRTQDIRTQDNILDEIVFNDFRSQSVQELPDAPGTRVGDFGYLHADTDGKQHFTVLGHMGDIFRTLLPMSYYEREWYRDGETRSKDSPWLYQLGRREFALDEDPKGLVRCEVEVTIVNEYRCFFWSQAGRIAQKHGVDVTDVVLLAGKYHTAECDIESAMALDPATAHADTCLDPDCDLDHDPFSVYFYEHSVGVYCELPGPWGFWSFEQECQPPYTCISTQDGMEDIFRQRWAIFASPP